MTQLIEHGRQALQVQDYERAASLFRESVRRAPFRQDLKDLLAMAVDGALQDQPTRRAGHPASNSTFPTPKPRPERPLEDERVGRQGHALPRDPEPDPPAFGDGLAENLDRPVRPRETAADPFARPTTHPSAPTPQRPPSVRPRQPQGDSLSRLVPPEELSGELGRRPQARPARPEPPRFRPGGHQGAHAPANPALAHRARPKDFSRRHQRGPLSAIFLGCVVGLLLIGIGVGFWFYYQRWSSSPAGKEAANEAQFNVVMERALQFRNQSKYSEAIDQLKSLAASPKRDQKLAELYSEKGDQLFKQRPPNYQGAIADYTNALNFDKNPKYGNYLGEAYYRLGKEKTEREEAKRYFALARQSYEAVLQQDPKNLDALNMLAKVAVAQRDDVLLAKSYKTIIEKYPDSKEAEAARRQLRSLGYRF